MVVDRRYLRIFLTERVVVMRTGRDLARRMMATTDEPAIRELAARAQMAFSESERAFTSYLRQLGCGPPRLRMALGGLAVAAGRLKLNGSLVSRSPLADLEELDALAALVTTVLAAWTAVDAADVAAPDVVERRGAEIALLAERVQPQRLAAARRALEVGR